MSVSSDILGLPPPVPHTRAPAARKLTSASPAASGQARAAFRPGNPNSQPLPAQTRPAVAIANALARSIGPFRPRRSRSPDVEPQDPCRPGQVKCGCTGNSVHVRLLLRSGHFEVKDDNLHTIFRMSEGWVFGGVYKSWLRMNGRAEALRMHCRISPVGPRRAQSFVARQPSERGGPSGLRTLGPAKSFQLHPKWPRSPPFDVMIRSLSPRV